MEFYKKSGAGLIGIIFALGLFVALTFGSYYFWSASFKDTGPFTATSTSIIDVGVNLRNEALDLKKKLESRYYGNSGTDAPTSSASSTGPSSTEGVQ